MQDIEQIRVSLPSFRERLYELRDSL